MARMGSAQLMLNDRSEIWVTNEIFHISAMFMQRHTRIGITRIYSPAISLWIYHDRFFSLWLLFISSKPKTHLVRRHTYAGQTLDNPCIVRSAFGWSDQLPSSTKQSHVWYVYVNKQGDQMDQSGVSDTRAPSQYKDRLIYVWRFPC